MFRLIINLGLKINYNLQKILRFLPSKIINVKEFNDIKYYDTEYYFKNNVSFTPFFYEIIKGRVYLSELDFLPFEAIIKENKLIIGFFELVNNTRPNIKFPLVYLFPFFIKLKKIPGKVAVIGHSNNYYHWLFDYFPRIYLANKMNKIDFYLVGGTNKFIKNSFDCLKIDSNKIIYDSGYFEADKLIIPSSGSLNLVPSKTAYDFVRKTFLPKNKLKQNKKIYVVRGKVNWRKIINEEEVISFFKKIGFVIVDPSTYSVKQQANMFNSAKIVVGFHGAAMSNIVFCQEKTNIVEFLDTNCPVQCYQRLSILGKLNYFSYPVTSMNKNLDVVIDLKKLKDFFC